MKTINSEIDIFNTLEKAEKAFNKVESADLLYASSSKMWYVDVSKDAIKQWPKLYTLISTK